jgi:hypothetical protein
VSKYIPKVGEAFQFINEVSNCWVQCGKVIAETHTEIAYLHESNGEIRTIKKDARFFPAPTKADVEWKQLIDILRKDYLLAEGEVEFIQDAGFTIPKKIKRSELFQVVANTSTAIVQNDELVVDAICELLGDLVEQDDNGGAE